MEIKKQKLWVIDSVNESYCNSKIAMKKLGAIICYEKYSRF